MENKKNDDKRLDRKIPLHFLIGLNVALLLTLAAFEWKSEVGKIEVPPLVIEGEKWDEPPLTRQRIIPPKPKPTRPDFKEVDDIPEEMEILEELIDEPVIDPGPTEIGEIDFDPVPEPIEVADEVYTFVEVEPEYKGGWKAFYSFVGKNTKYPRQAKQIGVEGKVYVEFIIEKDGSISNVKIVKGLGAGCDEETIRVLEMLPAHFEPARMNGKPVRKKMQIPFYFQLK